MARVTILEAELEAASPDMGAIEAWRRKDAEYAQRCADLESATAARNQARAHLLFSFEAVQQTSKVHTSKVTSILHVPGICSHTPIYCPQQIPNTCTKPMLCGCDPLERHSPCCDMDFYHFLDVNTSILFSTSSSRSRQTCNCLWGSRCVNHTKGCARRGWMSSWPALLLSHSS